MMLPSTAAITPREARCWALNSDTWPACTPRAPSWPAIWMTRWRTRQMTTTNQTAFCAPTATATGCAAKPIMISATGSSGGLTWMLFQTATICRNSKMACWGLTAAIIILLMNTTGVSRQKRLTSGKTPCSSLKYGRRPICRPS